MVERMVVGLLAGVVFCAVLLFAVFSQPIAKIAIRNIEVAVDIADDPTAIERGLGGREFLRAHRGMLFVLPEPIVANFWMKDMKFPVDVLWIDANKKIVHTTENVTPDTFPQTFSPPVPVQYVLELNAGWAKVHHIEIGDDVIF